MSPNDDIYHSTALSEDGAAWAEKKASTMPHPMSFEAFSRQGSEQHPLVAEHLAKFGVAHTCLGRRLDLGRKTAAEAEDAANGELHESGEFGPLSHEEQEKRLADTKMWVPHKAFAPADIARQGASGYASRLHLPDPHLHSYEGIRTSTGNLREIGRAYDNLPLHDPGAVPAFEAMRDEVRKQHDHMTNTMGIKTEVVDHDPYPTVRHMVDDVVNNKRIKVLSTRVTGGHQFMSDEDNDKFRAVHDVFGHAATGRAFDAHGEEAAWLAHSRMFTPAARPAMSSETRGQNSALHINGTFQAQKTAILPRHMWDDSAVRSHASRQHDSITIAGKVMRYTGYDGAVPAQGWLSEQRTSYVVDGRIYSANAPLSFEAFVKQAHDSGDGETIYHCPFCGSGQVLARSDRTIECEFCHTCFTVQVQPQYSAFPQTVNGVPVDVPGMPGQIGADPAAGSVPPGGDPADPNAPAGAAGGFPPGQDGGDPDADGDDDSDDGDDKDDDGGNPFAKGSALRTSTGAALPTEAYLAHLALVHSDDRMQTLAAVRGDR